MSNLKAIALTDDIIANLTKARDEMQAQHDETIAMFKGAEERLVSFQIGRVKLIVLDAIATAATSFRAILPL